MILIKWKAEGITCEMPFKDDEQKEANDFYKGCAQTETFTEVMAILPDGRVCMPKRVGEKTYAVKVRFNKNDTKLYTYESDEILNVGEQVLVDPMGQLKIVTVVECAKVDKTALPGLCNSKTPRKILAKIVPLAKAKSA